MILFHIFISVRRFQCSTEHMIWILYVEVIKSQRDLYGYVLEFLYTAAICFIFSKFHLQPGSGAPPN